MALGITIALILRSTPSIVAAESTQNARTRFVRRLPLTFWAGLLILIGSEALLVQDLYVTGRGAIHSNAEIQSLRLNHPPTTTLQGIARLVAVNMTPLAWVGYLLLLEGILKAQGDSPVRRRPNHFFLLCLASIFIWCIFDWINFYFIQAWRYLGFPKAFSQRVLGYFLAFGTIVPGMLLSGQVLLNLGLFERARSPAWKMPHWATVISMIAGVVMLAWPFIHRDPITNLTLWNSLVFLLDPLNLWLGRPSMFRDWQNGWYGRTLAAFSGGLICGLLWEFWNYWALAKWTYRLPFLGAAEHVRYFEMPVLGLLGFLPFGIECWIMWQMLRIPLDGLVEPLPNERTLL